MHNIDEKLKGLSAAEVRKRQQQGLTNDFSAKASKTTWDIIRSNIFSLFNLLNFLIALALIAVQAWTNLVFIAVISFNALTGILTELRAKKMVEKLNLLSRSKVNVIRSGKEKQIEPEEIVLGDIIRIPAGEQVPSDAVVLTGVAEANEAMLTGESDLVLKELGSAVLSGSFLSSGQIYAEVSHVGADNYATRLMIEAKNHKPINSGILKSLDRIAGFTSKIIIPFGIALFLEAFILKSLPVKESVVSSSSALLGMLPKGLALLTITALLTAVIKLAMKKILVQEMYSVETLARVDTICLDKTGTITEGKMKVEDIHYLSRKFNQDQVNEIIASYINLSEDNNPTAKAIRNRFADEKIKFEAVHITPFSSDRKWGAIELKDLGTVFVGAPERLIDKLPASAIKAQEAGSRVLAVAFSEKKIDNHKIELPEKIQKLAIIEIADPIRAGAEKTLDYLRSQEVDLKIISGDNPITVSAIAKKAGFDDYENFIDCSNATDAKLKKLAEKTAIFGRVSPQQKKLIVQTLKAQDHTVAMTGDGVNDILALREADCSIAMAEGDAATRQIANLVLLKSDFNDMPQILFEGRRVVNNITRIAPIFFVKTIYSFILAVICILSVGLGADMAMIFPFIPIQITLIDQFIEGFTPFCLSFESNDKPVEKHFLKKSMLIALPNSLMIIFSVLFAKFFGAANAWTVQEISTFSYYMLGTISLLAVIRASLPLNWIRSALIIFSAAGFFGTAILFRDLIEIGVPTANTMPVFAILSAICVVVFAIITFLQKRRENAKLKA